jgi:hypothetical protein
MTIPAARSLSGGQGEMWASVPSDPPAIKILLAPRYVEMVLHGSCDVHLGISKENPYDLDSLLVLIRKIKLMRGGRRGDN